MEYTFRFGDSIYYVPRFDPRLARYVPITCLRLTLHPPLLILGHHLVISPRPSKNGAVARDYVGTYWISKESYEAYRASRKQPLLARLLSFFDLRLLGPKELFRPREGKAVLATSTKPIEAAHAAVERKPPSTSQ